MNVEELAAAIESAVPVERVIGDSTVDVAWVQHDSRLVGAGDLFVCIRGMAADGHAFAAQAVDRGAVALVCEHALPLDVAQIICADPRRAMAHAAAALAGRPSAELSVVGVTGTNGKTTVVTLLADVLRNLGETVEIIGTLTGSRTTPESNDLQAALRDARTAGAHRVVMEVSSHALDMGRVDATEFEVVGFTNLSVDHLDYHGNLEAYFAAKSLLFDIGFSPTAVIDVSSPHGRLLADTSNQRVIRTEPAEVVSAAANSLVLRWRGRPMTVPLGGTFNAANVTLVGELAVALGFEADDVVAALATAHPVPGRFEAIDEGQVFAVIVDYAHTPEGLESVLAAARGLDGANRVIVVFGCGGDRDRTKRPDMGRIAETHADLVVVTSDNPRSEPPSSITDEIVAGMQRSPQLVEIDRRAAIAAAFDLAGSGDVVVIAGKGHEPTQTIGDSVLPFDDRVVARELLRQRGQNEVVSA